MYRKGFYLGGKEMLQPCISIIVPIYNVEQYLERCIQSIRNQTLENIEIILVDDQSPDRCPEMCDVYCKEDSRIKVIHKTNQGLGYARNSGLELATGEYIYFIDSDDYLDKKACERLYKEAKLQDVDICFSGIVLEDENGNQRESVPIYAGKTFKQPEITEKVLAGMMGLSPEGHDGEQIRMSAWQGIYKRSFIEKNKLRFPSEREFISEDIIFHIDALPKANNLKYIPDCLYKHVVDNPSSLTHKYNPQRFNKCTILYLEEVRRISKFSKKEMMKLRAQEMYLGNVRVCIKQIIGQESIKGKKFVKDELKKVVKNSELQTVLKTYPYWKNPIKRAIFSFALKLRCLPIIYLLIKIGQKS